MFNKAFATKNSNPPTKDKNNSSTSSQIIINQNGSACFNNFNIYTNNIPNLKTSTIHFKQYVNKKVKKPRTGSY